MVIDKHELLNQLSRQQAVKTDGLRFIGSVDCVSVELVRWAEMFTKPKQCFNNALNCGAVRDDDVVVGYVLIPEVGIFIEHAWNYCEELGHYDLTAQLHWMDGLNDSYQYVELIRFASGEALDMYEQIGGIDHMALRHSEQHVKLFR